MKVTFLGTSHGIAEKDRFTSSILITVGDKNYVIDAGAPITKLLRQHGVDFKTIGGIFITHAHADHYMGLLEFMCQVDNFREFEGVRLNVYAPKNFPFVAMREFIFGKDAVNDITKSIKIGGSRNKAADTEGYRIGCEYYSEGEIFNDGTLKVSAIPTLHFPGSCAFLLEAEGKSVLITGDLRPDLSDFPAVAFSHQHDLIITEAAHPLLNAEPTVQTLGKCKTKKLLITHICDWRNTPEMAQELAEKLKGKFPALTVNDNDVFEI